MPVPPLPATTTDPHVLREVWRASELARTGMATCQTGFRPLDRELPNGGWPRSAMIELLPQQPGIGEMQLLQPVLRQLSARQRVAFIQPPYQPHAMACRGWELDERNLLWLRPHSSGDALWAAEQVLRNGSCGALILWQSQLRPEALRRLALAAQGADTLFWMVRPLAAASSPSPAPLRIALRPAARGIQAEIVKRRGPHCERTLFIPLAGMPADRLSRTTHHEAPAERAPAAAAARIITPELV